MSDYDSYAVPDSLGTDFWFAEKTMWYQDHVIYGKPMLEVYSTTKTGGDQVRGIAPMETRDKRAEYPCSITSPSDEEIEMQIMQAQDRRIVFYIDEDSEEFPDHVDVLKVQSVYYDMQSKTEEPESGRCEIVARPIVDSSYMNL